jgi:hypothetical protein
MKPGTRRSLVAKTYPCQMMLGPFTDEESLQMAEDAYWRTESASRTPPVGYVRRYVFRGAMSGKLYVNLWWESGDWLPSGPADNEHSNSPHASNTGTHPDPTDPRRIETSIEDLREVIEQAFREDPAVRLAKDALARELILGPIEKLTQDRTDKLLKIQQRRSLRNASVWEKHLRGELVTLSEFLKRRNKRETRT